MNSRWVAGAFAAVMLLGMAACAAGGGSSDGRTRAAPTRTTVRLGGAGQVEMYTEAGVGARTIPVPIQAVWESVEGVYAQLEIPVNERDPRAFVIGNMGYEARRIEDKRMNTWVDCGSNLSGQLANLYEVTISVVTRLTVKGEGTEIATTVDSHGEPRTTSGNQVHCQSRGTLEKRVADLVAGRHGIGGGTPGESPAWSQGPAQALPVEQEGGSHE